MSGMYQSLEEVTSKHAPTLAVSSTLFDRLSFGGLTFGQVSGQRFFTRCRVWLAQSLRGPNTEKEKEKLNLFNRPTRIFFKLFTLLLSIDI
jgi:hypothetical protein